MASWSRSSSFIESCRHNDLIRFDSLLLWNQTKSNRQKSQMKLHVTIRRPRTHRNSNEPINSRVAAVRLVRRWTGSASRWSLWRGFRVAHLESVLKQSHRRQVGRWIWTSRCFQLATDVESKCLFVSQFRTRLEWRLGRRLAPCRWTWRWRSTSICAGTPPRKCLLRPATGYWMLRTCRHRWLARRDIQQCFLTFASSHDKISRNSFNLSDSIFHWNCKKLNRGNF